METKKLESVDWSYFDKFEYYNDILLPSKGDGITMASQAVTACCKLVYKYYNDGDVYCNEYYLDGWVNDISGSANWLYKYISVHGKSHFTLRFYGNHPSLDYGC